ncbi:unnamed protein product [Orchesella dallaii]|uniref:FH2 domain-containing protein n=1 Tax=Orchesella dallaii TaxID=48710 RepID=A0ABP1QAH4_9HEXA
MSLSRVDENNLAETIAIINQTLKKCKKTTLELKQRNNRTLEETEKHSHDRRSKQLLLNSQRFSESISYTPNNKATSAIPRRQSCTVLYNQSFNQEAQSDSTASHALQHSPTKARILPAKSSPKGKSACNEDEKKKSGVHQQKLRKIIFQTLDRLFYVNNNKTASNHNQRRSKSNQNDPVQQTMGLDTLRKLNENVPDTLPKNRSSDEVSFPPSITRTANKIKNETESQIPPTPTMMPQPEIISNVEDENLSNSSDNESWLYIPTPLKYEVVIESSPSSLEYIEPVQKQTETTKPSDQKDSKQFVKNRLSKKLSQKENKIQKRIVDRHASKEEKRTSKNLHPVKLPKAKIDRADSPLQKKKQFTPLQAASLPNLMEESYNTYDSHSVCGTNSFLRDIALRPSSTLSKSVPCITDVVEEDNDNYSLSSSFSSFQMREENDDRKVAHPSALCRNVAVMPIDVPIAPWNIRYTNIEDKNGLHVKKLKKSLIHENESLEQTEATAPLLSKSLITEQTITEVAYTEIINHSQEFVDVTLSEFKPTNDLNVVLHECSWLENLENDKENLQKTQDVPSDFSLISRDKNDQSTTISTGYEQTSSSMLPPPPPPPLMNMNERTTTYRDSRNLPLPVFTQPHAVRTIFTNLENIPIEDKAMKRLKENYSPKKSHSKSLAAKLFSIRKCGANSTTPNYKLSMEIFLKTWEIKEEIFLEAVRTLHSDSLNSCIQHVKNNSSDTGCISSLIQVVSKLDGVGRILTEHLLRSKKAKLDKADNFINSLVSIRRLKEKLECIQFSMDVNDSSDRLSKRIESFVDACQSVNTSEKFLNIIKLVMSFLNCLNSGGSKIYGFDIRGLCKLATNTFHDGTTTLLHFLIEYISNEPSLKDAMDFHKDFQHLSEVAKTSLKDMEEEYTSLKMNEAAYKKELGLIKMEHEAGNKLQPDLGTATVFQQHLENVVKSLFTKLEIAKKAFNSCKERYGLMNSGITEVEFFKSLSDFIAAYQKIHAEIIEQRNRATQSTVSVRRSESPKKQHSKLPQPKRKSLAAVRISQTPVAMERTNPTDELDNCLMELLENGDKDKRRARRSKKF